VSINSINVAKNEANDMWHAFDTTVDTRK